ncbi:MAG: hypothetical protein ABIJ56_01640 [Pseudomonadota bacterium]
MPKKEKEDTGGGMLSRIGFSGWMLLTVGLSMLGLHLCKNQGELPPVSEWDFFLRGAGKVVVMSGDKDLLKTDAQGAELVSWKELPAIETTAHGTDAGALRDAIVKQGGRIIIVGSDMRAAGKTHVPGGTILERLASFAPVMHFHPLMIRRQGAVYELREEAVIEEKTLRSLVSLVRKELGREETRSGPDAAGKAADGDFEVAVHVQGLKPTAVGKQHVNRIRTDLFAAGRGGDLETAALLAAGQIKKIFNQKYADSEGDLKDVAGRCRLELHVAHDFTLVDHMRGEQSEPEFKSYLDLVFRPGIYGVYVNRLGKAEKEYLSRPRSRMRLPSDAVYWMRATGEKIVERIVKDMNLAGIRELEKNEKLTVDRFRTIHVTEKEPGGDIVLLSMSVPLVSPDDPGGENLRVRAAGAADWLGRSQRDDGSMTLSYMPDRDNDRFEKSTEVTFDASRYIMASMAFLDAAELTGDDKYGAWFDKSLPTLLSWLKACPGASAAGDPEGIVKAAQVLELCGPVDRGGKPVAVETWGQGGDEEKAIPDDLVFVFGNTRAGLMDTALLGLALARDIAGSRGTARKDKLKELSPVLEGIAAFVLFMQRGDGSFQGYFVDSKNAFYRSNDLPGGFAALLFLLEAGKVLEDEKLAGALEQAVDFHVRLLEDNVEKLRGASPLSKNQRNRILNDIAWGLASLSELSMSDDNEQVGRRVVELAGIVSASAQLSSRSNPLVEPAFEGGFVVKGQLVPDYNSIVMTGAMAAAALAAKRWAMLPEAEELERAAKDGIRFSSQLQLFEPACSSFGPDPGRAEGGIRQSPVISRQRIDFSACYVWACAKLLKLINM